MTQDLSQRHAPIGSFLDGVADDWERYRLSDEQVAFFHQNGYLKGVRILTDEQVETLRAGIARVARPAPSGQQPLP